MKSQTLRYLRATKSIVAVAFAIAVVCASNDAHGVDIWSNPITDTQPSLNNPYTAGQSVNSNITVSGLGATGVSANTGSNRFTFSQWATTATTDFFSWTLTPNANFKIDFTSLTGNWQASSTGPNTYALRSSADGFAANIANGSITNNGSAQAFNLGLGAAAFDAVTSAITFRRYAWNPTGQTAGTFSINDFVFDGAVAATVVNNNSIITAPATAALGRVMLHQTPTASFNLTKTGSEATTYSATPSAGVAVTVADGVIGTGSQSEPISVQLQDVAAGSGSTGAKSINVVIDNLAATTAGANQGSADPNDTVAVTATAVDNRNVTASAVSLGSVIKGAMTAPATSSLTTSGSDDSNTRVTVNGTSATNGSVTVAAGASQLFSGPTNGSANTVNRSVQGTFASAGAKSGSVVLSVTGENLTGESVNGVSVAYTANVYDPSIAKFASNGGSTVTLDFGVVQWGTGVHSFSEAIYSVLQAAGFTAELDFDIISGTGNTGVLFTDLMAGEFSNLAAGSGNAYGFLAKLDASTQSHTGVYSASYDLGLSDSDQYTGHGAAGSQHLTLNITGTIVPESGWTVLIVLVLGLPVMAVCRRSLA